MKFKLRISLLNHLHEMLMIMIFVIFFLAKQSKRQRQNVLAIDTHFIIYTLKRYVDIYVHSMIYSTMFDFTIYVDDTYI